LPYGANAPDNDHTIPIFKVLDELPPEDADDELPPPDEPLLLELLLLPQPANTTTTTTNPRTARNHPIRLLEVILVLSSSTRAPKPAVIRSTNRTTNAHAETPLAIP
jgi:hypothetical protein